MLHPLDDYPIHQTADPLLHFGTDSPNAYDRFFFNGYDPDGEVFFAVALGAYPNRQVMDGAFSVIRDGVQHNVRASRRIPADRTETSVGPLTVEIVEPMISHRITVDGELGISADLTFRSISPAIEEPRFRYVIENRVMLDYTRLTQFGKWEGWIDLDGERIEIGDDVVGCRDRSWGMRPVGDRIAGPASAPQFFWIWCPTVFDDACTHFALNHDASGHPWHQSGAVTPLLGLDDPGIDPGRVQRGTTASIDVVWETGTRWASSITTALDRWQADPVVVSYEPFLRFQMSGLGYGHPHWRHGRWIDELAVGRDEIVLSEVNPEDPTTVHIQALSRARWGDRVGIGVVEQFVIGAHEPTGLTGIVNGAT
jgi:hypothetical protein